MYLHHFLFALLIFFQAKFAWRKVSAIKINIDGTNGEFGISKNGGLIYLLQNHRQKLEIFNVKNKVKNLNIHPLENFISNFDISSDGKFLIVTYVGTPTRKPEIWNISNRKIIQNFKNYFSGDTQRVKFSPNGERAVLAGNRGSVVVWGKDKIIELTHPDLKRITRLQFVSNSIALFGESLSDVYSLNLNSSNLSKCLKPISKALAFTASEKSDLVAYELEDSEAVQLFDFRKGILLNEYTPRSHGNLTMSFSRNGKHVCCYSSPAATIEIWGVENQKSRISLGKGFSEFSQPSFLSKESKVLLTKMQSGQVCLYDANSGNLIIKFEVGSELLGAICSPNENCIYILKAESIECWKKFRPEQWWGLAWLWEFWATLFFGIALVWSLRRDRRYFKSIKKKVEVLPSGG